MKQLIMIFDFRDIWNTLYQPIYDCVEKITQRDPLDFEIEMMFDEFMKTAFCRVHEFQPNMHGDSFYVTPYGYPHFINNALYSSFGQMVEQQLIHWMRGENAFPLDPKNRYKILVTPEMLIVVRLSSQWQTHMV